ncbi:iron ABC transporter permease [Pontibacillus halophilus JSM 076056 = DSM 19796]|uniref:Iron ABC transporter permease n=1 Tax=Pontibacillus halophilus JSM 076056 = DSM 19796 TaxID=1385510 RepID=A0A0A5GCZ1_9BACI|nr:iron ABC transporter permease [Pontibacillus halophilus]KGX91071.1 iron ABC transporter permease [Pontibacillus halophilus JSM 076056 = DSM 19796]
MKRLTPVAVLIVLLSLVIGTILLSMNVGVFPMTPLEVVRTLIGVGTTQQEVALYTLRLPRITVAVLVGMALAVSGAMLQGVSRNGLADPGILGINSGAGLAVIMYMHLWSGSSNGVITGMGSVLMMPLAAFVGAFVAAILIYSLATKRGELHPTRLILVGIGVSAGFSALIIIFQLIMNPQDFLAATVWLTGSIWGSNWMYVFAILPWIVVFIPYSMYKARFVNVIELGASVATGLGVQVDKERRKLLFASISLAAAGVAVGGGISFLGLLAPHIARRLVGRQYQLIIPASALLGAALLVGADIVSRNLLAPNEIPVGIVVSIVGAPYFLYLLMRSDL